MDGFTWVKHAETGGYWQCPNAVLDEMREKGWEPSEAPEEPNPAVAERIAWERELAEKAEAAAREAEAVRAAETPTTTRAARRGESQEG